MWQQKGGFVSITGQAGLATDPEQSSHLGPSCDPAKRVNIAAVMFALGVCMSRIIRRSRLAAAAFLALAASSAPADTIYHVYASFVGGGTLTGSFSLNQYGYLADRDLVSTAGGSYPGFTYTNLNNSSNSPGNPADSPFFVAFFPVDPATQITDYKSQLRLAFAHTLTDTSQATYNILADSSFECAGGFGCQFALPDNTVTPRFIAQGYATTDVPEPATWGLMVAGFGAVGAAMRLSRRYRLSALRPA